MSKQIRTYQFGDREQLVNVMEDCTFTNEDIIANNPAYTMDEDGDPIACGGILLVRQGVGQGWLAVSRHAHNMYPLTLARDLTLLADQLIGDFHLHRLQALVRPDFETGQKLLEKLGFKYEGYMHAYTEQRQDCLMYAKWWRNR